MLYFLSIFYHNAIPAYIIYSLNCNCFSLTIKLTTSFIKTIGKYLYLRLYYVPATITGHDKLNLCCMYLCTIFEIHIVNV